MRAAVFSCVGTAGQRCTTTRRLILHNKIKTEFLSNYSLKNAMFFMVFGIEEFYEMFFVNCRKIENLLQEYCGEDW